MLVQVLLVLVANGFFFFVILVVLLLFGNWILGFSSSGALGTTSMSFQADQAIHVLRNFGDFLRAVETALLLRKFLVAITVPCRSVDPHIIHYVDVLIDWTMIFVWLCGLCKDASCLRIQLYSTTVWIG